MPKITENYSCGCGKTFLNYDEALAHSNEARHTIQGSIRVEQAKPAKTYRPQTWRPQEVED